MQLGAANFTLQGKEGCAGSIALTRAKSNRDTRPGCLGCFFHLYVQTFNQGNGALSLMWGVLFGTLMRAVVLQFFTGP